MQRAAIACAALAAVVSASPAPAPQLDYAAIAAATPVPQGPAYGISNQTATLYTSVTITGAVTAATYASSSSNNNNHKRDYVDSSYTPYYAALATSYTTDPALAASKTTTAGQACVTQPEAGTYCGFINPLDACAPQADGYGPVPSPDTASAFLAFPQLHQSAQAAPTSVPSKDGNQYSQVFKDLQGSVSGSSYIGLYTLSSYSAADCAARCDATDLCTAFNIFSERDPSLNPANNDSTYDPGYQTVWGQNCPNPPSMTSFKCTLWGSNIDSSMATNTGSMKEQFQIVITGSDGYDKTQSVTPARCSLPPSTSSTSTQSPVQATKQPSSPAPQQTSYPWKQPENCGGKGINSPRYSMGGKFFPGPYNPQVCSNYALLQNEINTKSGKKQCQMFNAQYLHKDGIAFGTYCSLYSSYLSSRQYATIDVTWSGGSKYECKQSWTYTINVSVSASWWTPFTPFTPPHWIPSRW